MKTANETLLYVIKFLVNGIFISFKNETHQNSILMEFLLFSPKN